MTRSCNVEEDMSDGDADAVNFTFPIAAVGKLTEMITQNSPKSSVETLILTPMKWSVRLLSSVIVLLVVSFTVTSLLLVSSSGFGFSFGSFEHSRVMIRSPPRFFNSTLLEYAAVDLGHAPLKKEIDRLMEDNGSRLGRYRLSIIFRRFRVRGRRATTLTSDSKDLRNYWSEFKWLLNLWHRNMRYQPAIMDELVQLVKDPIDRHNGLPSKHSGKKYGSCAVVGNSGILLQKEYGKMIDSHDAVIRLNNARTEGFAKHVGTKTTISFINSNILHLCSRRLDCSCHPYGPRVPILMYICQPLHFLDYELCNSSHKAPLLVTDPRFDVLCARIVKYYSLKRFAAESGKPLSEWNSSYGGSVFHYSSGIQAVMLAVGMCRKVSIFGFGKSPSASHHYHTNQKAELRLHHYEAEYDFYNDLVHDSTAIPFVSETFTYPYVSILQ